MGRVTVLAVGGLKESYLREGVAEYAKRLSRYTKFEIVELPEVRVGKDPSQGEIDQVLEKEGQMLLSKIPRQAKVISLCIEGKQLSSSQLAQRLALYRQETSHIAFLIGSSHGLSSEVKTASDLQLSLSSMTFPHQLARLLLTEQIYRGFSILGGSKYHK